MPDDRIKFSQLSAVLTVNTNDIIPGATENGASDTGYSNVKFTIAQLAAKINEAITFSGLETESKYIVPAINEIKELISSIPQFDIQVVQTLPTTGVSGTVYLVPAPDGSSPNMYEEYLWINNSWEKLGSASVDLSNYYNKNQINGMLADVYSTSESYNVGDIVIYNNYLYVCIGATSGAWDSSKWSVVKLSYIIPKDLEDLDNVNIQNPTHRQGLVYDNPSGKWINDSVGGSADITTYDNTESGLSADNVQDAIDELEENIEGITEPQKTVSGSVVTFSDSLPNSPLLACKASIEATQSGSGTPSPDNIRPITAFDTVIVRNTGKNSVILDSNSLANSQYCNISYSSNTTVVAANSTYARAMFATPVKIGKTYTLTLKASGTANYNSILICKDTSWSFESQYHARISVTDTEQTITVTFTAETEMLAVGFYVTTTGTTGSMTIKDVQLELGSTATAYEPFKGSTHTVSLGQTVGRGTLNVTTGELTITHNIKIYDGSEGWTTSSNQWYFASLPTNMDIDNRNNSISNYGIFTSPNNNLFYGGSGLYVQPFFEGQTIEQFKTALSENNMQVLYKLATPVTVQLSPEEILTITGENNISANSGDVEVTYRTPFYVSANSTSYDNSTSGLAATNVQEAIDELAENSGGSSYSTEERVVGTWIDGKPLYEKTYSYTIDDLDAGTMTTSRISGYFDIDQDFDLIWLENGFFYNPQAGSGTDVLSCNMNYPNGSTYVRTNIQKLNTSSNARIYFDDTYAASSFYGVRDTLKFYFTLRYTKPTT